MAEEDSREEITIKVHNSNASRSEEYGRAVTPSPRTGLWPATAWDKNDGYLIRSERTWLKTIKINKKIIWNRIPIVDTIGGDSRL